MIIEIYEHLISQESYIKKEPTAWQELFYFLFWHCILLFSLDKNKINLKGQILISDATKDFSFGRKKYVAINAMH